VTLETYLTTKTEVSDDIKTLEFERFLMGFYNQWVAHQFAQQKDIPKGKGDTIEFERKIDQPQGDFSVAENADVVADKLHTTILTATAAEHGRAIVRSKKVLLTSKFLGDWDEMTDSASRQAAEYLDGLLTALLATNAYRLRADKDPTFTFDVTATSDGAAGGTTFISSSLVGKADVTGGFITVKGLDTAYVSKKAYTETRPITGFNSGTGTVTVTVAFSAQLKTGVVAHIVVGTGIVSSDVLDHETFSLAVRQLERNQALRFDDNVLITGSPKHKELHNLPPRAGVGYWVNILSSDMKYDFMMSDVFKDMSTQQDKDMILNGYLAKWMGTKIFGTTKPYREDVDGTKNLASGAVHIANFLGQEAYGISAISGPKMESPYGVSLNFKEPKDFGDYGLRRSSVAWEAFFAYLSLNSLWNVGMMVGCTP